VIQVLGRALKDAPPKLRASAARSAGRLGTQGKALLPALRTLGDDPNPDVASDALLAIWCIEQPDARVSADDLALLPPDSEVIIHVRVRTLLEVFFLRSGLLDDIRRKVKALKVLEPFGVEASDILALTLGSPDYWAGLPWAENKGVLVLRGRFEKAQPGQVVEAKDFGKLFHAACLTKEVIVVSTSRKLLAQAVARNTEGAKLSPAMQKVVAQADTRAMFWLASSLSHELRRTLESIRAPDGLTGLALMGDLDEAGILEARLLTADAAATKAWKSYLDEHLPLVQDASRGKGRITTSENSVRVRLDIPRSSLEAIARNILGP
jgi:hypothetical protein